MNLFVFSVFLIALIASTAAHWDSAYFRNAGDGFKERKHWMSHVPGRVKLSEMAIPGTHDSAANGGLNGDALYTQCINFYDQLRFGIRFFDIRIRHFQNSFALYHGIIKLDKNFDDFLKPVHNFLTQNPSETVLFRLKEEQPAAENSRSKLETLDVYLSRYSTHLSTTNSFITLDQARGKFIIFSDNDDFYARGISYASSNIQDAYNLGTNWDLYGKWEKVKSHLIGAKGGDKNTFYINYLSGSGGSFPYFVASGHSSPGTSAARLSTGQTTPGWRNSYPDFPRVNCFIGICTIAFEGTNTLTKNRIRYFNQNRQARTVGIIMADFPGVGLIHEIIRNNWMI